MYLIILTVVLILAVASLVVLCVFLATEKRHPVKRKSPFASLQAEDETFSKDTPLTVLQAQVVADGPDECHVDSECGTEQVCRRAAIYTAREEDMTPGVANMSGWKMEKLAVDLLEKYALNVDDVREFEWDGERWLVISTSTPQIVLHRHGLSRLVQANIAATDLHVGDGKIYMLANGQLYYIHVRDAMRSTDWTCLVVKAFEGITVTHLEGSYSGDIMALLSDSGTYFARNGKVERHLRNTDPIIFGNTKETNITFKDNRITVLPNNQTFDGISAAVMTTKNKLYHFDPVQNNWAKRFRSLDGDPVIISRAVCQMKSDPVARSVY